MTSDETDKFLKAMSVTKVELDAKDRMLAGAGINNDSWGEHIVSNGGNYIESAVSSGKNKGGRSIG